MRKAHILKDGKATNEELKMTVRLRYLLRRTLKIQRLSFVEITKSLLHHSPPPPPEWITARKQKTKSSHLFVFLTKKSRSKRQDQTNISFLCIEIVIVYQSFSILVKTPYSSFFLLFFFYVRKSYTNNWNRCLNPSFGGLHKDRNLMMGFERVLLELGVSENLGQF